jgi:hypothetical protein
MDQAYAKRHQSRALEFRHGEIGCYGTEKQCQMSLDGKGHLVDT